MLARASFISAAMNNTRFASRRPETASTIEGPVKPVVKAKDIDCTVIPWTLQPEYNKTAARIYRDLFWSNEQTGNSHTFLLTGSGLSKLKGHAQLLASLGPIDALATNDGQQVFIRSHQKQDTPAKVEGWLNRLQAEDADQAYQAKLYGWNITQGIDTINELLVNDLGYKQVAQTGQAHPYAVGVGKEQEQNVFVRPSELTDAQGKSMDWIVRIHPDQAYFEVRLSDELKIVNTFNKPQRMNLMATEAKRISSFLERSSKLNPDLDNPRLSTFLNPMEGQCFIHLAVKGATKGEALQYLLNKLPKPPQAIITAGDSKNDISMLGPEHYSGIPNYPVQVGNNPSLTNHFKQTPHPNRVQTKEFKLYEGIEDQWNKLKAQGVISDPGKTLQVVA